MERPSGVRGRAGDDVSRSGVRRGGTSSEVHLWVYGGGWDNGQAAVDGKTINVTEADKVSRLAGYLRPNGKADLRWGRLISYRADFIGDKRAAAVKRATCYTICQPAPKLIDNIRVSFHVNDDNKDKNSVLGIQIIGSDNRVYAAASDVGSGQEWSDGDDKAVNIPISIPITASEASDLTRLRLEVCMASRGVTIPSSST